MSTTNDNLDLFENSFQSPAKKYSNIELGSLKQLLLSHFGCSDINAFFDKIKEAYKAKNFQFYKDIRDTVGLIEEDYLQKLYQYYIADREKLKQDYTPLTLAQLTARLAIRDDASRVLDCCCGSGALTIQAAKLFPKCDFECLEIDENVLPVLDANLNMRKIKYKLKHYDVVTDSNIEGDTEDIAFKCDYCISNPPFNIKWKHPLFAQQLPRFSISLPPESNANFVFLFTAMYHTSKVGAFILPKGVMSSEPEKDCRAGLVNANLIEAVISCPGNMFESTDIPTCILVINKQKTTRKICFIKIDDVCSIEERAQSGQFGGNSHEKRIYTKRFNVINKDLQDKIVNTVLGMVSEKGFSKIVDVEFVKANGFDLSPSKYVLTDEPTVNYRSYESIVSDINAITKEKNKLKITINEQAARCFGNNFFMAVSQIEKSNEINKKIAAGLKENGIEVKFDLADNVKVSKDKNVIRIEQNANDGEISHILISIMNDWANHYRFLNILENKYLAELRDKSIYELIGKKSAQGK